MLQAVHKGSSGANIALACHGSELSIWDLQQGQKQYQAKGNKPNRIGLVDKPWNTAAAFLPGSEGQRVAVGTAYHKLRIYDVKSKRPALDMEFGEAKITTLAPQSNGQQRLFALQLVNTCAYFVLAFARHSCMR